MSVQSFTDKDLDNLIASIEESLDKAEVLAKSKTLKKDDGEQDEAMEDAPPAAEAAPQEQSPGMGDQSMEQAPAQEAPEAPEAAPSEEGEEALKDEGEDAPLSDEELAQIYGHMNPEELERHFMVIRQVLQSHYEQGGEEGQEQAPEAPEAAAAPQMPEEEQQEMAAQKSAKEDELIALKKTIEEQSKSIELLGKAFEALTKPQRKAVTDVEYIRKSEVEENSKSRNLSKDEIRDLYGKINPGSLSKGERSMVNNYFLNGENKKEVEQIIQSKGGKF
jgi:outer membrane biosynthesis protein TonB